MDLGQRQTLILPWPCFIMSKVGFGEAHPRMIPLHLCCLYDVTWCGKEGCKKGYLPKYMKWLYGNGSNWPCFIMSKVGFSEAHPRMIALLSNCLDEPTCCKLLKMSCKRGFQMTCQKGLTFCQLEAINVNHSFVQFSPARGTNGFEK